MSYLALHRHPQQKPPIGSRIDWGHPLSRGLVGCWLFGENSGTRVCDSTGKQNHRGNGIIVGLPRWFTGGLQCDGSSNYVKLDGYQQLNPRLKDFTYLFSVTPLVTTTQNLFTQRQDGNNTIDVTINTSVSLLINTTGVYPTVSMSAASSTVSANKSYHIAIAVGRVASACRIYINGEDKTKGTPTTNTLDINILGNCTLGASGTRNSNWFNGNLGRWQIYERALSRDEVRDLYRYPHSFIAPIRHRVYFFGDAGAPVYLQAVINVACGAGATLQANRLLSASIGASARVAAAPNAQKYLAAQVGAGTGVAATVGAAKAMSASIGVTGGASGAAEVRKALAGVISTAAGMAATLSAEKPLVALVALIELATGLSAALTAEKRLAGTIGTATGASASIVVEKFLAGEISAEVACRASLQTTVITNARGARRLTVTENNRLATVTENNRLATVRENLRQLTISFSFAMKTGDVGNKLWGVISEDGAVFDASDWEFTIIGKIGSTVAIRKAVTFTDAAAGEWEVELEAADLATKGNVKFELRGTKAGDVKTFPSTGAVQKRIEAALGEPL